MAGLHAGLGMVMACQPPHSLQPRLSGSVGQTVGCETRIAALGWSALDGDGRRRLQPGAAPDSHVGPFIMNPEGVARLFSIDKMNDGPFPEHYEPIESPIGTNPLHPAVISSPVARIFR